MSRLDPSTILRILLGKTDAAIADIRASAEAIALSGIGQLSALGSSTTFNAEDANVILGACAEAARRRAADPLAGPSSVPRSNGHYMRFSAAPATPGLNWGL